MKATMKTAGVCCGPVIVTNGWICTNQRSVRISTVVDMTGDTTRLSGGMIRLYPIYTSLEDNAEVELFE